MVEGGTNYIGMDLSVIGIHSYIIGMDPYVIGTDSYTIGMDFYLIGMDSYMIGMDPCNRVRKAHFNVYNIPIGQGEITNNRDMTLAANFSSLFSITLKCRVLSL